MDLDEAVAIVVVSSSRRSVRAEAALINVKHMKQIGKELFGEVEADEMERKNSKKA